MNDNRVTLSNYVWVAMAAVFLLVLGGVWLASSPREVPRDDARATTTDTSNYEAYDRDYTATVPAAPPMPPAPVFTTTPANPSHVALTPPVTVTPLAPQAPKPLPAPQAKPKPKPITPRDMFPVGDITRDLPRVNHPYRQIAELYPAFEYKGRLWMATGRYVLSSQAALASTGLRLATGQNLFGLANASAPDRVMFVQSSLDPNKFAVYRAS